MYNEMICPVKNHEDFYGAVPNIFLTLYPHMQQTFKNPCNILRCPILVFARCENLRPWLFLQPTLSGEIVHSDHFCTSHLNLSFWALMGSLKPLIYCELVIQGKRSHDEWMISENDYLYLQPSQSCVTLILVHCFSNQHCCSFWPKVHFV